MDSQYSSPEINLRLSKSELTQTSKDESMSGAVAALFKDAYEHPAKTALEAAAVLAVGGAIAYGAGKSELPELLAGKYQLPEFLGGKAGVLLIEDTPGMGKAYKAALEGNGHKVTWVTGIKSLNPLTGFTEDGGETELSKRFKIAFVDGDLGPNRLTGPEIVGTLRDRKTMVIGTSTVEDFNVAMRENSLKTDGSIGGIAGNKGVVYASILGKQLDLKAAVRTPGLVQEGLDTLGSSLRKPENSALKKAANETLMKFLLDK